jgi:serine/threonine-protein kinase
MAPEQARGELSALDARTDVYALGAILYQVLTRRPPHRGVDAAASLARARAGDVLPPAVLRPHFDIPAALADIAMKALAPEPAARYGSALELRDAVRGFLAGGAWFPQRRFAPGEVIVVEGEDADVAFVIASGTCEAARVVGGRATVMRRMGPGDVFGETALLTGQPRSATVTAVSTVVVTVISRDVFESELSGSTWLGAFARAVALRFREAERRADLAVDVAGRVIDAVRVHLLAAGQVHDGELAAPWSPLRQALAVALGLGETAVDDVARAAAALHVDDATGLVRLRAPAVS